MTDSAASAARKIRFGRPKVIAHELLVSLKGSASVDWSHRESARARVRVLVKRILRKHGYHRIFRTRQYKRCYDRRGRSRRNGLRLRQKWHRLSGDTVHAREPQRPGTWCYTAVRVKRRAVDLKEMIVPPELLTPSKWGFSVTD
jgi:hypothetical protein